MCRYFQKFAVILLFSLFQFPFAFGKEKYYNITSCLIWNKWIDNSGNKGEAPSLKITEQEKISHYIHSAEENVSYKITGRGGMRAFLWSILDTEGRIVTSSGANAIADNKTINVKRGQTFVANLSLNTPFFLESTIAKKESNKEMRLILFDDFHSLDSTLWGSVDLEKTNYASIFRSTAKNCFIKNGNLHLTVDKTGGVILGPYLSTAESFSIKKGRFEARIKLKGKKHNNFLWCFFSFGQNAEWPEALEFDVIEKTINSYSVNTHWAENGNHCTDSRVIGTKPTLWHIYAVEWDEKGIIYSIDGETISYLPAELVGSSSLSKYPMDLRLNVKVSDVEYDKNTMIVDWVKVFEQVDIDYIEHPTEDIIYIPKGQTIFLQSPRFDISNNAFTLDIENPNDVVEITNSMYYRYGPVVHAVKGLKKGTVELFLIYPDNKNIKKKVVVN